MVSKNLEEQLGLSSYWRTSEGSKRLRSEWIKAGSRPGIAARAGQGKEAGVRTERGRFQAVTNNVTLNTSCQDPHQVPGDRMGSEEITWHVPA